MNLTDKQEAFCNEYLIDFNATRAAIVAGYSQKTARYTASENLTKPNIQGRLKELYKEREKRTQITQDRVLEELAYIAFFDIRNLFNENGTLKNITDLDEETARALAAVDVDEHKIGKGDDAVLAYFKRIKALDKKAALELLGKHLGMFADLIKVEVADQRFNEYLSDLYAFLSPSAKVEFSRFAEQYQQDSTRNYKQSNFN